MITKTGKHNDDNNKENNIDIFDDVPYDKNENKNELYNLNKQTAKWLGSSNLISVVTLTWYKAEHVISCMSNFVGFVSFCLSNNHKKVWKYFQSIHCCVWKYTTVIVINIIIFSTFDGPSCYDNSWVKKTWQQ